jgi:hypothetical protein
MTRIRRYRFECCWFLVLFLILLFDPSSSSAQSLSWADFAFDCDWYSGWCIGMLEFPGDLLNRFSHFFN